MNKEQKKKGMSDQDYMLQNDGHQNYLAKYGNTEYFLHYNVSTTNIIVYMCFMYGSMMPGLYMTGLLAVGATYLMEKINLAYLSRKPDLINASLIYGSV